MIIGGGMAFTFLKVLQGMNVSRFEYFLYQSVGWFIQGLAMFLRCGNEFLDGACHDFFCGEVSLIGYFETYMMNNFFCKFTSSCD